jgi:murein DD-endopeptidase MepM/ murein hydrolase activator NlpD
MIFKKRAAKEDTTARYAVRGERAWIRSVSLIALGTCLILAAILLMNNLPVTRLQSKTSADRTVGAEVSTNTSDGKLQLTAAPASAASPAPPDTRIEPETAQALPAGVLNTGDPTGLDYLVARKLLIPVEGIIGKHLHDSFLDARSEGRTHRAIDIMSTCGTPVRAAADGVVTKLHNSDKGGISLYQTDSCGSFVYFYGHLQRYADGICEGKQLKRGEVIAYVGDTGNAGAGNCHLHFGISKPPAPGKWSGGEAINPYPLLGGE